MSSFLLRGYNTAIPEVDVGDDIFVVKDVDGTLSRIQVKATASKKYSKSKRNKDVYSVQFNIKKELLLRDTIAPFYFIFLVLDDANWEQMLIFPQEVLSNDFTQGKIGTEYKKNIKLWLKFESPTAVYSSKQDYSKYLKNWQYFPKLLFVE